MTFAASERIGISRQRGFWLRCFLERMLIFAALVITVCGTANANVCVYKTLHIRSVHGNVVDETGQIVPGAKVLIKRDQEVIGETTTDQQGRFRLNVQRGKYWLTVQAQGFAPSRAYVSVGFGMRSVLHSNTLHMIVRVVDVC